MADIRPYLVIYRHSKNGWICADVGEKSAYARWFGQAWAKSAKGALSESDHAGDDFNSFISRAYSEIYAGGSIRVDHLHAYLPREEMAAPQPVSFQRVLAGCMFPDGQKALSVLVAITNKIDISALKGEVIALPPADLLMDNEQIDDYL
jgi:hypothetical protein